MNLSKVLPEGRTTNQKTQELTITRTKIMALPRLKSALPFKSEVKDKLDLKETNDPDKIKITTKVRNKGRKMCSVFKVKCRNDERMKFPHIPRKFKWNNNNKNKEKMRTSLNSMHSQKYVLLYL